MSPPQLGDARLLADARPAAIVVLALAVAADHADRLPSASAATTVCMRSVLHARQKSSIASRFARRDIGVGGSTRQASRYTDHRTAQAGTAASSQRTYTRPVAHFLDAVPFSGIIRIRDMMYAVKDPFRLDQGDVSFDAPETVKRAMHRAIDDNHSHYVQTTGIPRLLDLLVDEAAHGQRHSGRRTRRGHGDDRRHPRALHRRARRCSSRATR